MEEALKSLWEELKGTSGDQAMFLHLASLILFAKKTNTLLQASGKFVPSVLNYLDGKIEIATLRNFQELVVVFIKSKNTDENASKMLSELQPQLLEFVDRIFHE